MINDYRKYISKVFIILFVLNNLLLNAQDAKLYKNVRLIDGTGNSPIEGTNILVKNGKIVKIGKKIQANKSTATIDLQGKTVIPALISAHTHIGTLKGLTSKAENYTIDNIQSQLKKYADYGVLNILVMGSDRPILFESGLRENSKKSDFKGSRIFTAGYGFGAKDGAPPLAFGMDKVFRPISASQVKSQMDSLTELKPDVVKLWVDDFNGKLPKVKPSIYKEVIKEAHKNKLKVAGHIYYLSDLKYLLEDNVDLIGHSVRDSIIDNSTIALMKQKEITYIPTLSVDKFAYAYGESPEWIKDKFFINSLEPRVLYLISTDKYKDDVLKGSLYQLNSKAFETAKKNLVKVYKAGILVAMGTDSGAIPLRTQGFSEHFELELMVEAGLTPLQAITIATLNAAKALGISKVYGTLEKGKFADFIVLDSDPLINIKNTRRINMVVKGGNKISNGPL